jgi:peptide/nickel transport system substrate-binding protein
MFKTRIFSLLLAAILVAVMVLVACGTTSQPPAAPNEASATVLPPSPVPATEVPATAVPVSQATKPAATAFRIGTTDKVTVLDAAEAYSLIDWEILRDTADGLLHYKLGTDDLEPGLAKALPEVSADGLEYTFHLVEGARFPDGTPFNAEAVKWTIDRAATLQGSPSWMVTAYVDHVEVVDEYTVKFVLQAAVSYWPLMLATPIYAPASPNCYAKDAINPDSTCGGLGPYKVTKWERDVELDLEAYDGYPGAPPKTPKIIEKFYADSTTLRLALENGEIDLASRSLDPTDYADFEAGGRMQVISASSPMERWLGFHENVPPFDKKEVRQAFAYAVDRDAIVSIAFKGTHDALYSPVPVGIWSHIDTMPKRDLEKAKELLTSAGYSPDSKLVTDLWWTPSHYGPTETDVATVLKGSLEETGLIQVNLKSLEWATFLEYRDAGSLPFHLLGWFPDYLDPDNYTWPWAHSTKSNQKMFYANEQMDKLLEAGQRVVGVHSAERLAIYEEIQKLWAEDMVTIPLTQGTQSVAAQPNVKGVVFDPGMQLELYNLYKE